MFYQNNRLLYLSLFANCIKFLMKIIFVFIWFIVISSVLALDIKIVDTDEVVAQSVDVKSHLSVRTSTLKKQLLTDIPVYSVFLSDNPKDRYKQIIQDKFQLLNAFVDQLYKIKNFKYSMWIAKTIFYVIPDSLIRTYLGEQFFDECQGIAKQSKRQTYEIIVYNYMYEIGAAKDFCTSIALTQKTDKQGDINDHKQNLSILARNLDYGFQQFLTRNTIKINFYSNRSETNPLFTTLAHAGFTSSHTVLKYQSQKNIQFALSLNQRRSQNIILTWIRIIFTGCESVFQLTNRILTTDFSTIEQLITFTSASNSCSKFYFIIQVKNGDHVLIQKNQGVGVHRVYFEKQIDFSTTPFFIVQTNTDQDKKDLDGRRNQAIKKIDSIILQKGYVQKQDLNKILLQKPNFNDLTLMTALIDVQKGQIQAMVWDTSTNFIKQYNDFVVQQNQSFI